MRRLRFSVSLRIYTIIGLSFCGLIGLAIMQANNLKASLKQQRQSELSHLAQVAVGIAREEYDIAVRDHSSDDLARKSAAARISKMRYGNGDYFWINDLGPRMIMHPAKPELNGQDLTDNKDPAGKQIFVEFVNIVKKHGSGFIEYQWPKPGKDAPQPKLSFVAGFEPWGWVIGTALGRYRRGRDRRASTSASPLLAVELSGRMQASTAAAGSALAAVLRSGRRIEVGGGFDAGALEQLVRVLEAS